jgi:hypothetical protein
MKPSVKLVTTGAAMAATDLIVIAEEPGVILPLMTIVLTFGLPYLGFKLGRYQRVRS